MAWAGLMGLAPATTVLHVSGSTAFRATANNAFGNILQPGWKAAFIGSNLSSASQAVFVGTTTAAFGGQPVVIETDFTGSATGIVQVAEQITLDVWLDPTANGTLLNGTNATAPLTISGGTSLSAGTAIFDSAASDAVFSDVYQASAPVGNTLIPLTDSGDPVTGVGGVAFLWMAGKGSPTSSSVSVQTTTAAGSFTITVSSAAGLAIGETISGNPNIPAGAVITGVMSTTVTLSLPALSTGSGVQTQYTHFG